MFAINISLAPIMLDQILGGSFMAVTGGAVPPMLKGGIVVTLFLAMVVIMLFSFIPMGEYPGYAKDPKFAPAYWTGFSLGAASLLIYAATGL